MRRIAIVVAVGLILLALAYVGVLGSREDASLSGSNTEGESEPHHDEVPVLRGAQGGAHADRTGVAPAEASREPRNLRVRGIVWDENGPATGAAVMIANNQRMGGDVPSLGVSDKDGRFDGTVSREQLRDPTWVCIWASMTTPEVRASLPVFRNVQGGATSVSDVRLELREGTEVTARIVNGEGRPVPRGLVLFACFVPGLGTKYFTVPAGPEGHVRCVLPVGSVVARARQHDGPFGPPATLAVSGARVSESLGDVIAPAESVRISLQVVDDEGAPVPSAFVRTSDHASRFLHEQVPGELVHYRADDSGRLRLPPMAESVFPIAVAAASPRHHPRVIQIDSPPDDPVTLGLVSRPYFDIQLQDPSGGALTEELPIEWIISPRQVADGPGQDLGEAYPLQLESSKPVVGRLGLARFRVHVPQLGSYECRGVLPGGAFVALTVGAGPTPETHVVKLPAGRAVRVRARLPNEPMHAALDLVGVSWAYREDSEPTSTMPWAWELTSDRLDVLLWAPEGASAVALKGVGPTRAPWTPMVQPLPPANEQPIEFDLAAGLDTGGTLVVRLGDETSPAAQRGVNILIAPNQTSSATEWLIRETDAEGMLRLRLPPGRFRVSLADQQGDPRVVEVVASRVAEVFLPWPGD